MCDKAETFIAFIADTFKTFVKLHNKQAFNYKIRRYFELNLLSLIHNFQTTAVIDE